MVETNVKRTALVLLIASVVAGLVETIEKRSLRLTIVSVELDGCIHDTLVYVIYSIKSFRYRRIMSQKNDELSVHRIPGFTERVFLPFVFRPAGFLLW